LEALPGGVEWSADFEIRKGIMDLEIHESKYQSLPGVIKNCVALQFEI